MTTGTPHLVLFLAMVITTVIVVYRPMNYLFPQGSNLPYLTGDRFFLHGRTKGKKSIKCLVTGVIGPHHLRVHRGGGKDQGRWKVGHRGCGRWEGHSGCGRQEEGHRPGDVADWRRDTREVADGRRDRRGGRQGTHHWLHNRHQVKDNSPPLTS